VKVISEETGISEKHLYTLERKYQEDPSMADRERSGRAKKVTTQTERMIISPWFLIPSNLQKKSRMR